MPIKLANNASGTLATAISASDTGIVLTSGNGALFPSLAAGEYFYATLASSGGTLEIVKVTARSGDSLTVVRAQEGTSAAGFAAGARFELRVTAQSVRDAIDDVNAAAVSFTPYGSVSSTNVQSAIQEVVDEINILSTNTFTVEVITATAAQTVFNLSNPYVVGSVNLSVYMNGLRLRNVVDYVETNSTRVTLTSGAQAGDELTFVVGREVNDGLAASSVSFIPAGTGAIARTAQEKMRDTVSVKDFGAVGDGVADDTAAIQAALNSGAKRIAGVAGDNYKITAPLQIANFSILFEGNGSTITQATTNTSALLIGYNGAAFVQVSNITVSGFVFVGADNGLTSTTSAAIDVYGTSSVPFTNSNGCQRIKVQNCHASGWCFGVAATGVNGLHITGCYFTGMKYHASLVAGGYGVLAQTCFDVQIIGNRFVAQTGDRHAIYMSSDPARTYDVNNVCKQVVVADNVIDWTGVSAITGFESCLMSRGVFDFVVSNNVFKGGYGGIDYEIQNAPGENISITGNVFDGVVTSGTSTRGAVNFLRSTGSYRATNVSVSGNSIKLSGEYAIGVQIAYVDRASITGNTINSPNNTSSFGVNCIDSTEVTIGGNTIFMGNGYGALVFNGSNDKITINRNELNGASYFKYKFFSSPTNLKFGFPRSFRVTCNGSGSYTISDTEDEVVASATSEVNGLSITLEAWGNADPLNLTFAALNSSVGWVYHRTNTGTTVVCGVTNHGGTPLPAATNAYSIIGTLAS